jgi:2-polyprenyl-6-methoxyphenol hydroxylase-like FAD-dependent oxidoreductase
MLGLLLARAGLEVVVLEKHADFLRDFRGDTIHPSTLQVLHELGALEAFLRRPHQQVGELAAEISGQRTPIADFTHLRTRCRFLAIMPQWDFLDFLAQQARPFPGFSLRMRSEVTGLLEDNGRVVGVQIQGAAGSDSLLADLVVGADGRSSRVRASAGLTVQELGAPMDVLWFRLPGNTAGQEPVLGRFEVGRIFVRIARGDYWQCGLVIPKGGFDALWRNGLAQLRQSVEQLAGVPLPDDVLRDWNEVHLLTVRVDRLQRWHRPGLLCIGDAAHAMSPVGGVGINLAIQDAVAAANLLVTPLRADSLTERDLARVQRRRELPTRITQWLQVVAQNRVIRPALESKGPLPVPRAIQLLDRHPWLRRIPAAIVGLGVRAEHVRPRLRARLPATRPV